MNVESLYTCEANNWHPELFPELVTDLSDLNEPLNLNLVIFGNLTAL
jgi:hypothetical protein